MAGDIVEKVADDIRMKMATAMKNAAFEQGGFVWDEQSLEIDWIKLVDAALGAVLDAIENNEAAIGAVDVLACELAKQHNADGEQCWKAGIAALRKEVDVG